MGARVNAQTLIVGEEERLVLPNRASDRSAELVLLELRLPSIKESDERPGRYCAGTRRPIHGIDLPPERVITLTTAPPDANPAS